MQVARAAHNSAGFYVTAAERVEVSVRRVVWRRTFVFLSDGVFVAPQCCGLAVGNRVLMAEVSKELRSPQMSKPFVSEEVVLHLIALVLRVWIRGRHLLVHRVSFDASLVCDGELRPDVQRRHRTANDMEAEHSAVAHGHADVPALQKPLYWIRFASCGFHAKTKARACRRTCKRISEPGLPPSENRRASRLQSPD